MKDKWLDSPDAVRTIKSMVCLICQKSPVDAHHIKTRGSGGHDFIMKEKHIVLNIVPLCREHHTKIHEMGVDTFKEKFRAFREYLKDIGHPFSG